MSLPPRCALIDTGQSHMAPPMHATTSTALAVKEMEPGKFHRVLLEEEPSDLEPSLVCAPATISDPHANAAAA